MRKANQGFFNRPDLQRIITALCVQLMPELERRGIGARRLDLVLRRVDRVAQAIRIGTARPSRDGRHLAKLLGERLVCWSIPASASKRPNSPPPGSRR